MDVGAMPRRPVLALLTLAVLVLTGCAGRPAPPLADDDAEALVPAVATPEAGSSNASTQASQGPPAPPPASSDPPANESASNETAPAVTAAPPRFDPGWPRIGEAAVRPGVKLFEPLETQLGRAEYGGCTASFVFSSLDNRTLYVATASHCVSRYGIGDPIVLALGKARGVVAYCSFGTMDGSDACPDKGLTGPPANDFALIRIDDADRAKVHPAMLGFGGPTGIADAVEPGAAALTYGNTDLRDVRQETIPDALDARAGRVRETSEWTTIVTFDVNGVPGDSGSPALLADGRALGVVQTLDIAQCSGGRADSNAVANLFRALQYLHEETDLRVELKTWPLLASGSPAQVPACTR